MKLAPTDAPPRAGLAKRAGPTQAAPRVEAPGQGLVSMGNLHYARTARPRPDVPEGAVIQRVRAVKEEEWAKLEDIYDAIDHYDDVLSHSSSIPPRLPREFFPLYAATEETYYAILQSKQVPDEESIARLEEQVGQLDGMMNFAKRQAAKDRAALQRGGDRPPSKTTRFGTLRSDAMEQAQALNNGLDAINNYQHNLALLRSNRHAVFYVMGKSAMGQGDTAFVVRAVSMLRSLGLNALGVKSAKEMHSGGTSFSATKFITPEDMRALARPGDFIIEGPLSDFLMPPMGAKDSASYTTEFDLMKGFSADKAGMFNLRLYEYGTLSYRAGQAMQERDNKNNVIYFADRPRHGFMGMGHGEMGAFYNAGDTRLTQPLGKVLATHAGTSKASEELLGLLERYPEAEVYLGYANERTAVTGWVTAVCEIAGERSKFAIVVGIYGELRHAVYAPIPGANTTYVRSKRDASGENQSVNHVLTKEARCIAVIADGVPAPVMAALQKRAMPFTLSTGNYSLSEAVENGHFPIYEMLKFNAGVQGAFQFQVANGLAKLELTDTDFGRAAIALSQTSPESLPKMKDAIRTVLNHPYEIRLLMGVIRANTDIKENFVARLAALVEHG
jgi:hypothetical protein